MTSQAATKITKPAIGTEMECTDGAREGCRGRVVNRKTRGAVEVELTYAPRTSDYSKGAVLRAGMSGNGWKVVS